MTKEYKIVSVTTVGIDIDKMYDIVKEAISNALYNELEIEYEHHETIISDLLKEIAKKVLNK